MGGVSGGVGQARDALVGAVHAFLRVAPEFFVLVAVLAALFGDSGGEVLDAVEPLVYGHGLCPPFLSLLGFVVWFVCLWRWRRRG